MFPIRWLAKVSLCTCVFGIVWRRHSLNASVTYSQSTILITSHRSLMGSVDAVFLVSIGASPSLRLSAAERRSDVSCRILTAYELGTCYTWRRCTMCLVGEDTRFPSGAGVFCIFFRTSSYSSMRLPMRSFALLDTRTLTHRHSPPGWCSSFSTCLCVPASALVQARIQPSQQACNPC